MIWHCGVRRSVVLSSSVRCGVSWLGLERSCPVRLCKVQFSRVLLRWGPVLLGHVRFGSAVFGNVRRFMVRSAAVAWGTVERGFVWLGKVSSWQGGVGQSEVRYAKLSSWFGEVLFCAVGIGGALYAVALSGMVRYGTVESGFVRLCAAGQGSVRRYLVLRSWVMRNPIGRAWLFLRRGQVWLGTVLSCNVLCCMVRFYLARLCSPVYGAVSCGNLGRYFGLVSQGGVRFCTARHGNEE